MEDAEYVRCGLSTVSLTNTGKNQAYMIAEYLRPGSFKISCRVAIFR